MLPCKKLLGGVEVNRMVNKKAYELGSKRSAIRELFEYAKKRGAEIGVENVFDFSIGNPSVPAPQKVNDEIVRLTQEMPSVELHGYTSAQGDLQARRMIAENMQTRFGFSMDENLLYMTCGAAASLTVTMNALTVEAGDEFLVFAPFFPEYRVFAMGAGATLTVIPADENLQPDFEALKKALHARVRGVIINSPNNPSGVVYTKENMQKLAAVLRDASERFGAPVYLISDEPYRELVYDASTVVTFPMNVCENTIICYSYSKALSLPGERIGYIAVSPKCAEAKDVYAAVCGAGRMLGFVCAPALFQRVVAACDGLTGDLSVYRKNRDLLYSGLTKCGFECIYPDGAFYLFMKTPEADANAFCERAKKYELLLVPGDSFGAKGYVRIAYCVSTERIERALPAFEKLAKEYGLQG